MTNLDYLYNFSFVEIRAVDFELDNLIVVLLIVIHNLKSYIENNIIYTLSICILTNP